MINLTIAGGGRFEEIGGYARVRRVGAHVYVAGTTAVEPSGRLHAPGDTYRQTAFVLERIEALLGEAGAELAHVVLTRAYLAQGASATDYAQAHGEVFREVRPVTTAITAGLSVPGMMVEIEAEALVVDEAGQDA